MAASLLYPKYGGIFKHVNLWQMSVHVTVTVSRVVNIQQQNSCTITRKLHDATVVFGLKFADIVHYRHNVTTVGIYLYSLLRNISGNSRCRQPHSTVVWRPLLLLMEPLRTSMSLSVIGVVVIPEVEIWTYTGALGQLSWPKTASTVRHRLNRKWKYGGNMRNWFPVHGFLLDPQYIRGSICDRFGSARVRWSLENFQVPPFVMQISRKKIRVDRYVPNDFKWSETPKSTLLRYPNSVGLVNK